MISLNIFKRFLYPFFTISLFASMAAGLLRKTDDNDIWYHLSIGREIWTTCRIPGTEFLVYPNADLPAELHEWGFGVIAYLIHQIGGIAGLDVAQALIATLTLFLLGSAARYTANTWSADLAVIPLIGILISCRLVYRPELMLFLALGVSVCILERSAQLQDWRYRLWLIPTGYLLNLCHPSLIFLIVIVAAYGMQALWDERKNKIVLTQNACRWFLLICGILTLSLFNPYGIKQILLPFKFLKLEQSILQAIIEFTPTLQTSQKNSYILLMCVAVPAVLLGHGKRIVNTILLIFFGYLAYRYVRNVAILALVMLVPLHQLAQLLTRWLSRWSKILSHCPLMIAGLYLGSLILDAPLWGIGLVDGRYPVDVADQINKQKPPAKIFNQYDIGGYLGWELYDDYQVFIDGRQFQDNKAWQLYTYIMAGEPQWEWMLKKYGIGVIVTPATYTEGGEMILLLPELINSPEWQLVGRDKRALLFYSRDVLMQLSSVPVLDKKFVWEQIETDARNVLLLNPARESAVLSFGRALEELGRIGEARQAYQKFLRFSPGNSAIKSQLYRLQVLSTNQQN